MKEYRTFVFVSKIYCLHRTNAHWLSNTLFSVFYRNIQSFVLDQYTSLDFYSASSLKQQSVDRHVPHSHTLSWLILRVWEETTNTNSIVFDWPGRDCRQRSTTSLPLYHWCGSIVRNDMEISICVGRVPCALLCPGSIMLLRQPWRARKPLYHRYCFSN
jgi:hypothetical protein